MIEWHWLGFDDIPRDDWYEVLRQRQDVFILEQTCLYPDIDGYDLDSHHLMAWREIDGKRTLVAYLRCLPNMTVMAPSDETAMRPVSISTIFNRSFLSSGRKVGSVLSQPGVR